MGERWMGGAGDFQHVGTMMTVLAQHGVFADRLPLDPMNPWVDKEIREATVAYSARMKTGTRSLITKYQEVTEALRDGLLEHGELNSKQILDTFDAHGLAKS